VFVGSLDLDTLRPLVERYLGALPSAGHAETWRDVGIRFPGGVHEATVEKGQDPKSEVQLVFEGPAPKELSDEVQLQALARVVQGRLFSVLRQQLGGTYGVSAVATVGRIPTSEYLMRIDFTCDPARTSELTTRVFQDIAALKRDGPGRSQVADVIQSFHRDFETNSQKNAWLLGQLVGAYETGRPASTVFAMPELYNQISTESIQAAAVAYLDPTHYVKATLMPEKK
jgi:zinc protease